MSVAIDCKTRNSFLKNRHGRVQWLKLLGNIELKNLKTGLLKQRFI